MKKITNHDKLLLKSDKDLWKAFMIQEILSFMTENVQMPDVGSPVERIQLEMLFRVREENWSNSMIISAIEVIDFA